jgi:predicted ATPase
VAARVDLLGLRGLVDRLDDGMHRLTNSRRGASPRHRTLHAALDWSYALLSGTEQLLLRRFAVFASGFDLSSARAIASDRDISYSEVLNGLLSLGDKSLLAADVSDDNVIYRLLGTTRAYAHEKLRNSNESAEISRRHAAFLCGVWDGADVGGPGAGEWLEKHGRKIDDVRAAIDWCFSPDGDILLGQRLTAESGPLWFRLYALDEYRRRLQRALQARDAGSTSDAALDMKLNVMLGYTLLYTGDPGTAAVFDTALDIADRLADTATLCEALLGLGRQRVLAGDYRSAVCAAERASRHLDGSAHVPAKWDPVRRQGHAPTPESTALPGDVGSLSESGSLSDPISPGSAVGAEATATSENLLALTHHLAGHQTAARGHAERAPSPVVGNETRVGARAHWLDHRVTARAVLGRILWVQGLPDQAAAAAHDCVADALSVGHGLWLVFALIQCCTIVLWTGDMPAADRFVATLLNHAARHSRRRGHFWGRSFASVLEWRRGDMRNKIALRDDMLSDPLCDQPYFETMATLSEELVGFEAIARAETGNAGWCAAEILRAKAAAMLRAGTLDAATAETHFRRSLDIANLQGALSWELRAATNLAQLWQDQGRVGDAYDLLAPVYGRFAEGFGTLDLITARALLNQLIS